MSKIVLATLNARYIHSSFGLRYLYANLGALQSKAKICEFEIHDRTLDICEELLAEEPQVVGFGVYIWNVRETEQVVAALKKIRPEVTVVLGGPEVSFETERQSIAALADYIITGEADHAFRELCTELLAGQKPVQKIQRASLPATETLTLPYELYSEHDAKNRIVYVEASRGCPFTCEFCLSSLDIPVRQVPLEPFLAEMQKLYDRGVRHFKFVDRTFNLNIQISKRIMQFFLDRYVPGLFVHFEMVPDRLPEQLKELIVKFPPGALQFEVGIQSFNPEVGALISRRQNYEKLAENLRFLKEHTGVHVHADLIAGLPGEPLESFGAGFDALVALGPQEIQVGILKRLRGTPIIRHDAEWGMRYNPNPPYELLENKLLNFATMQRLGRFSRYWDVVANSGNFVATTPLLWGSGSAFAGFMQFTDWLYQKTGSRSGFSPKSMAALLLQYLTSERGLEKEEVLDALLSDFARLGRTDLPKELQAVATKATERQKAPSLLARQARHAG
ncbi:MAG: DUF4080 domain-containing protein [Proteobacteria bacterium]|nr:DUF4080 domain-containing protein [Pseudomonadota bacterium]